MKVPAPRKLPSGNYFIRLRLGGEEIPITCPTARDCTRQATLIKAEYLAGKRRPQADTAKTLGEIIDAYIDKTEPVLSPSTIRGYAQIRSERFQGFMDRIPESIDFQAMINSEFKAVSAKTLKNAWSLVHTALSDSGFAVPRITLPQVPVKEIPFLQPEEIPILCAAVRGDLAEIPILLELHGLRRSEAKGLDWKDVDLKRGTIRVHASRVQGKTGDFVTKQTNKNRSSSRTIPIMIPQLHAALSAVQDKSGPVVTVAENTMLSHAKSACERAGITVVGNHGLRHSFASLGYHLGLNERQLMDLGGWADHATMHRIYVRLAASSRSAAVETLSRFFQNGNENGNDTA